MTQEPTKTAMDITPEGGTAEASLPTPAGKPSAVPELPPEPADPTKTAMDITPKT